MDEREFRRLLDLFPVVRSRDFCLKDSQTAGAKVDEKANDNINKGDPFWQKLRAASEKKVGPKEAENFVQAFQQVYRKLMYEELSLDAARRFINAAGKKRR